MSRWIRRGFTCERLCVQLADSIFRSPLLLIVTHCPGRQLLFSEPTPIPTHPLPTHPSSLGLYFSIPTPRLCPGIPIKRTQRNGVSILDCSELCRHVCAATGTSWSFGRDGTEAAGFIRDKHRWECCISEGAVGLAESVGLYGHSPLQAWRLACM